MTHTKEGQSPAMSPEQFSADYTEYYRHQENDSPYESRRHLIHRLLTTIEHKLEQGQQTVRILDMGAGKQVLEKELQQSSRFQKIAANVQIITLDIAYLKKEQLLAQDISHVVADGSRLPFASDIFDVVYSSMAIDFMPRAEAFAEIQRVSAADASYIFNFHHPDLITKKDREVTEYRKELCAQLKNIRENNS
jgi:ubiquinone/menaquinone biosynthesis C-methylase UbiE